MRPRRTKNTRIRTRRYFNVAHNSCSTHGIYESIMCETLLDRCMQQPEHEEAEIDVIEEPAEEETTEVPVPKVYVPSPKCRESMLELGPTHKPNNFNGVIKDSQNIFKNTSCHGNIVFSHTRWLTGRPAEYNRPSTRSEYTVCLREALAHHADS